MTIQPKEKTLDQQITESSNSSLTLPPISPLKTPGRDSDKKKEEKCNRVYRNCNQKLLKKFCHRVDWVCLKVTDFETIDEKIF